MFMRPAFRLVPDDTKFNFMRYRFAGLALSALLSSASVALFFYPGLNLGIDFRGGIVMDVQTPQAEGQAKIVAVLNAAGLPQPQVQGFGAPNEVLVRFAAQHDEAATQGLADHARQALQGAFPGTSILKTDAHQSGDDPGVYLDPV
jgi:preprotein translocase subunit SecF